MVFSRRNIVVWSLYGLVFFLGYIMQYMVLNRYPLFGVMPALAPVAVACAAMFEGGERGGIYGICAGFFLFLCGEAHGAYAIAALGFCGIAVGLLCQRALTRTLISSFITALAALCIFELPLLFFKMSFDGAGLNTLWVQVIPGIVYSAAFAPLFFFPSRVIHEKNL